MTPTPHQYIRKVALGSAALALAVGAIGIGAPDSNAAGFWTEVCRTTGADGGVFASSFTPGTTKVDISLNVEDTLADGHHVAVRFVSETNSGAIRNWAWHHNFGGLNHSIEIDTTAADGEGIRALGFEVGRFEGSRLINHCSAWALKY